MRAIGVVGLASAWLLSLSSCERAAVPVKRVPSVTTNHKTKSTLPESAQWQVKRQAGIDFVAAGISPAEWSLDIDFSKQILFKPLSGSMLVAAMPKPQPMGKSSGVLLDARTGTGLTASASRRTYANRTNRLKVFIEPTVTRNNLTGRTYAYTVRVETNGRRYVGYGSFIKGSDRLDGTWTLETFRGQRLRAGQFPSHQLPQLTIDLAKNEVEGTTGCNKLKGEIAADGDHVQFTIRNTTNKKCSNAFEETYVEALQQASLFRIGKERLTLLANGQYVMTLVKNE